MQRHSHLIAVAFAGMFAAACQVGAGMTSGAQQPAQPMPAEPVPAAGNAGPAVGGPDCPNPENHCLAEDILFAGKKGFDKGYIYADPARMTAEPGPSGEATFMSVRDGANLVTSHYWRTRAAQANELAIGALAVMMHRSQGGFYVAPTTRDEANKHRWWIARIVSNNTLDQGYVVVSGGYKVNANGIRVIVGDESPTVAANRQEDAHFLQPGHWIVSKKPLPEKGYSYASLALAVKAPSEETGGEGDFLLTRDGSYEWTRYAWQTRPATEADLRPGVHVFMLHRSKGGLYIAPESRVDALAKRWWTAKIVDASELYKGVVQVAGGYKVAVDGLRVPI